MREKRVILINPPTPDFVNLKGKSLPSSLLYLGSFLKKNNKEVKILDIDNKEIDYISEIGFFQPDLIGITCLFSGRFLPSIDVSKRIKEKYPTIPIAIGGIHPTIFPKEIIKNYNAIDYVCIGEGEKTLESLVNSLNKKDSLNRIDGLAYRNKDDIKLNPKTQFIENLDELPFPDYELVNLKDYYMDTSAWYNPKKLPVNFTLPIISSRSCPNQCTFCSMFLVHGKKWRARSPKNVVDEIEYLYKKYDHRYFSFMDDNFTLSKKRTLEITKEIINRKLDIQFDTPNGVSIKTLDREVMDSLVKAGLVKLCVAPESGSEYIRNKVMKKRISDKTIYDFFDMIKDYKGLFVKAFFVVGYPQETKETLEDTYKMIERILPSINKVSLFNLVPFPGTEVFEECRKNHLINIDENNLHNTQTFSNYNESDEVFVKPYNLSIEEIVRFRERAYKLVSQKNMPA